VLDVINRAGAEAFKISVGAIPMLVLALVAVMALRASGAIDALTAPARTLLALLGIDPALMLLTLTKVHRRRHGDDGRDGRTAQGRHSSVATLNLPAPAFLIHPLDVPGVAVLISAGPRVARCGSRPRSGRSARRASATSCTREWPSSCGPSAMPSADQISRHGVAAKRPTPLAAAGEQQENRRARRRPARRKPVAACRRAGDGRSADRPKSTSCRRAPGKLPSSGLLPGALLLLSLQKISRLPEIEMTMPHEHQGPRLVAEQRKKEAMPIHSRLVVTSAVLLATEVYSSELIQVAKCSARKNPAPQAAGPAAGSSTSSAGPTATGRPA
jgi:hypothetical protein